MKRTILVLIIIISGIILFFVARLFLYIKYLDYFGVLSVSQVLHSFVTGVRFDLSVLMAAISPILLMLLIPIKKPLWKYFWGWTVFGIYFCATLVLITDIVYFAEAHRHLTNEVRYLINERTFVASVLYAYKFYLLALICCFALLAYGYRKLLLLPDQNEKKIALKIFIFILISALMLRGSVTRKPIAIIDGFRNGSVSGNLTVNGVFSVYRNWAHLIKKIDYYMDNNTAITIVGGNPTADYPLLQTFNGNKNNKNIVILVMESWSAYYMGTLNPSGEFHATPNFDKLAEQGALFTRHFCSGNRSIEGFQSLFVDIPPIVSIGLLGYGLETKSNGNLGTIAAKNGYDTILMQVSRRRSYYLDSIASALGFNQYYGLEDLPHAMDYPDPAAAPYGWDYDGLAKLPQVIDESGKPFLAVYLSGTTHEPFPELGYPFNKRKTDGADGDRNAFLNTLEYADYSLGQFMEEASTKDWFKDTIFIITADHSAQSHGRFGIGQDDYLVPVLIYSPDNIVPKRYDHITSHLDILPTVLNLAGISGEAAIVGQDMFVTDNKRGAFLSNNDPYSYIMETATGELWVTVQGNTIIDSSNPKSKVVGLNYSDELLASINPKDEPDTYNELIAAQKLLALIQSTDLLINSNRWNPPF